MQKRICANGFTRIPSDANEVLGIAQSIAKWINYNFDSNPFSYYIARAHAAEIQLKRDLGLVVEDQSTEPQ